VRAALTMLAALGLWATPAAAAQEQAQAQAQAQQAQAPASAEAAKPATGYILFRATRRMGIVFRREMSPAEEQAAIAAANRETRAIFEAAVADWDRLDASCRANNNRALRCDYRGSRPEGPGDGGGPEVLDPEASIVRADRRDQVTEVAGSYVYLVEARPGSYVLYGQRDFDVGVCLCMGSVRFEVDPGQIVDIGTISFPGLEAANARPSARQAMTTAMENSIVLTPPQPGAAPPAVVGDRPVHPAQLRAAEKQDNDFGLYIDRHPAIPGVLRYERDRVIDGRTGAGPAPIPDHPPSG